MVRHWALNHITTLSESRFKHLFGTMCFIPAMNLVQEYAPASLYAVIAYTMFNYVRSLCVHLNTVAHVVRAALRVDGS
jgi:hypothetical protein